MDFLCCGTCQLTSTPGAMRRKASGTDTENRGIGPRYHSFNLQKGVQVQGAGTRGVYRGVCHVRVEMHRDPCMLIARSFSAIAPIYRPSFDDDHYFRHAAPPHAGQTPTPRHRKDVATTRHGSHGQNVLSQQPGEPAACWSAANFFLGASVVSLPLVRELRASRH